MKRTIKITLSHVFIWVMLSLIYFFSAESITTWIFPEIHDVTLWLAILMIGFAVILIGTVISLIIFLRKNKKCVKG